MEVACFKNIRKDVKQGTNWIVVWGKMDGENRRDYL